MTGRTPLAPADFVGVNGRRVLFEGVVDDLYTQDTDHLRVKLSDTRHWLIPKSSVVEVLPEEIDVGDSVWHIAGLAGKVKAVDGDHFAVTYHSGTRRAWWDRKFVTLVEKAK